jgi:hypothetical protein
MVWKLGVGLCVAWGVASVAAWAGDTPPDEKLERVVALEAKVTADLSAKSYDALQEDAKSTAALDKEVEGKAPYHDRLFKILRELSRSKVDDVCKAAIRAVGEAGNADDGARIVRAFLRPVDDDSPSTALLTSLETIPQIPDDSLVEPLLKIVTDSKNYSVAAKAVEALGSFKAAKRKREKIVEELVKTVQKDTPGGQSRMGKDNQTNPDQPVGNNPGQGAAARWGLLSAALPKALNTLTGQSVATAEEWFTAVKQAKGHLGTLFHDT